MNIAPVIAAIITAVLCNVHVMLVPGIKVVVLGWLTACTGLITSLSLSVM